MNWKDLSGQVARYAPMLGAVLGGPAGEMVGTIVASKLGTDAAPSAVAEQLRKYPDDTVIKLQQIEADKAVRLEELLVEQGKAEVQAMQAVNDTMQVEAKSEHWVTYSWRPAVGFAMAFAVAMSVVTVFVAYIAAIFLGRPEGLQYLPGVLGALAPIVGIALPILGIASWFRGKMQAGGSGLPLPASTPK